MSARLRKYLIFLLILLIAVDVYLMQKVRVQIPATGGENSRSFSATSSVTPTSQASQTLSTPEVLVPIPSVTPMASRTPTRTPEPLSIQTKYGYRLVLDENFDGSELDSNTWNPRLRWGTTNPPELQQYTADALKVNSGFLTITADEHKDAKNPYYSGVITSFDRFYFQYGYVEIRAKVPKGQGLWPALWLLAQNSNSGSEIDIMEFLGGHPNEIHTTVHFDTQGHQDGKKGQSNLGPDYSLDFHTYAVKWEWDRVTWYIDGVEVYSLTEHVPHEPLYVIANLAVGGEWPGPPDETTQFPARFVIDYIRVYTK